MNEQDIPGPSAMWQACYEDARQVERGLESFIETVLAKLHGAEVDKRKLAQQIITLAETALNESVIATESDWPNILANGLEAVVKLCKEQLKGQTDDA